MRARTCDAGGRFMKIESPGFNVTICQSQIRYCS